MAKIVDSYSDSNYSSYFYNLPEISSGGSFAGNGGILDSVQLSLYKTGSPTGNGYIKIYAHTGTFGVDGTPTGSPLATSEAVDVSTIPPAPVALYRFSFTGANRIMLVDGTYYFLIWSRVDTGAPTNDIRYAIDISSPTHAGNFAYSTDDTSWTPTTAYDMCFYVYSENYTNVAKPTSTTYTDIVFQGKQTYDQYDVIYDDPNRFYDSVNQSQYTAVAKPTTTTYTDVAKPT